MKNFTFGKKKRTRIDISFIPIINVIFLMIIFFMVEGTLKGHDVIPIEAPISASGSPVFGDHVEVMVSETEIILNLELVDEQGLSKGIIDILQFQPDAEITIKADGTLNAARFIEVLDVMRDAGAKNLYLITTSAF